jgi:hypothetical protein
MIETAASSKTQSDLPMNAELWEQGLSLRDFIDQMTANQEAMARRFATVRLSEGNCAIFAAIQHPIRVLVMSEDWCGDSLMNLPILARLAEAAPGMELRVFIRSREPDLDHYYRERGITKIPVFTFMDANFSEIATWVERSKAARERLAEWHAAHPEIEAMRHDPALDDEERRARLREIGVKLLPEMESWYIDRLQQATVEELKEILLPTLFQSGSDSLEKGIDDSQIEK